MTKKYVAGIDFGTTNSAAGITGLMQDPVMVNLEEEKQTIPSALFFSFKGKETLFGRAARDAYLSGEEGRFMRSLKRILGTDLMNHYTQIGKDVWHFDEILSLFMKQIKNKIEEKAQQEITDIVLGRPVRFQNDSEEVDKNAQNKLLQIATLSGFKNIHFQFEPIAAAFAHEQKLTHEALAFIVDIGGGTSDFTLIRLGPNRKNKKERSDDILASTGIMIGGNDFDKQLSITDFMPELGKGITYGEKNLKVPLKPYYDLSEWSKINGCYDSKYILPLEDISFQANNKRFNRLLEVLHHQLGHKLLDYVEESKILLSNKNRFGLHLDFLSENPSVILKKEDFEKSISQIIHSITLPLTECLKTAGITADNVELVILTGGSTEIPLVNQTFKSFFKKAVFSEENKLSSVAQGLTYTAQSTLL